MPIPRGFLAGGAEPLVTPQDATKPEHDTSRRGNDGEFVHTAFQRKSNINQRYDVLGFGLIALAARCSQSLAQLTISLPTRVGCSDGNLLSAR
jgi:hypothetical protein